MYSRCGLQRQGAAMFDDLTVIDAASYVAGPAAATVMADFGAKVIKVEPLEGDGYRALAGSYRTNYNWLLTSRNKRSLALNLAQQEGQDVLHKLIEAADVLFVNFSLRQLAKYRLDYDTLKAINPRIVLAQLTGYGNRGPEANRRAFDVAAWWARAGVMDMMKPKGGPPTNGVGGVGDHASAMSVFGAIMMALYKREKTGLGSFVTSSLAANGVWSMGMPLQGAIAGYDLGEILDEKGHRSPFTLSYRTREGRYVMLVGANPMREWPLICQALNKSAWLEDPRFGDIRGVMKHRDELREAISEAFSQLTLTEAITCLDEVDATYSVVEKLKDVISDAQLIENEVIVPTGDEDPDYQWTINSPIAVEGEQKVAIQRAPELGEHTAEILLEAGFTAADVAALRQSGVIRPD
jgi:crotonobetainyl-CoA:carnitine CoA-transferase CaiB-like acyl-CoA transferase